MSDLQTLADLSREFGSADFVLGGGGNTSAKTDTRLWVKPSGTTLLEMTPKAFVELDRTAIEVMLRDPPPKEASAREAFVVRRMADAVRGGTGRPSVEAPLHHSFPATFVVHTHPAAVNAMTCGRDGQAACRELFPDALWSDYVDPGYTLCRHMRDQLDAYRREHHREPTLVFLKNHGVFVAANTPEEIRSKMTDLMNRLRVRFQSAGLLPEPVDAPMPERDPAQEERIRTLLGEDARHLAVGPSFAPAPGPLTPDHMVYARAFPFMGDPTEERLAAFREERGYSPKIIATNRLVYGLGETPKAARLALELARDAARVARLAKAFGGAVFMSNAARRFIETWEVESYRQRQAR